MSSKRRSDKHSSKKIDQVKRLQASRRKAAFNEGAQWTRASQVIISKKDKRLDQKLRNIIENFQDEDEEEDEEE